MKNIFFAMVLGCLYLQAYAQPGALDMSFNPNLGANSCINSFAIQNDGKVIIVGDFTSYNGNTAKHIARINSDGSFDTTFNIGIGLDYTARKVLVQPDGKIIAAGDFNFVNSVFSSCIVRLNTNGSIDTTFNTGTGFNARVETIALQIDGKLIVGGDFTSYNRLPCNRLVRLNTNGSYDTTFHAIIGANGSINSMAIQPDGKILIGGDFTLYDGALNWRVARANTDGTRDIAFADTMGASRLIKAIAVRPDGSILLGGNFTFINFLPRNHIAQLDANGMVEQMFDVHGADEVIRDIIIHNGQVLIVGDFRLFDNIPSNGIVKTNLSYVRDNLFDIGTGVNHNINDAEFQTDGKIFVAGCFTVYNGTPINRIARLYNCLTPQPDTILGLPYAECRGTAQTYTITPVAGATKYEWTLPTGWTGSSDSASITVVSDGSGGTISVKAFTPQCGFSYVTTLTIATLQPPGIDICLVTVDTASTHNIIIWEKQPTSLIDSFCIYRETTSNIYTKIATIPFDSLSEYHDYDANPNTTSYRYKMSIIDTCGAESALSPYHNTIHLQNLGNGNFQWTFYQIEGQPNPVISFNMNRDPFANGNFFPIGNIPGTNATFTDISYSSFPDAEYVVDVNWGISCSPVRATVNTTRSNIRKPNALITSDELLNNSLHDSSVLLYPNPTNSFLNVEVYTITIGKTISYKIVDALGKEVQNGLLEKDIEKHYKQINTHKFAKGVYSIIFNGNNTPALHKKLVIH